MQHDITEKMNDYIACLKEVWRSYYIRSSNGQFDTELLSCFYRTTRLLIVDLVIYATPEIDYRDYLNFEFNNDRDLFSPLKIIMTPEHGWKQGGFLFSDDGNLIRVDEGYADSEPIIFFGFRGFSEDDVTEYLEFGHDYSPFPRGIIRAKDVSRFMIRDGD